MKRDLGINEAIVTDALHGMLFGEWAVEDTCLDGCIVRPHTNEGQPERKNELEIILPDGTEYRLTIERNR